MNITSEIDNIISIITSIKNEADKTIINIKTCKLLARQCHLFIPSLNNLKHNSNRDPTLNQKLQSLNRKFKFCKDFITSHGIKLSAAHFFNESAILSELQAFNNLLNTSIEDLQLNIRIDDSRQLQEALKSDMAEIKDILSAIATVNNFRFNQRNIASLTEQEKQVMVTYLQTLLDNMNHLRDAINPSSTSEASLASGASGAFSLVVEPQLVRGELLGSGSFGDVYKCKYLNQDFALKPFDKCYAHGRLTPGEVKKISKEVEILKNCHHPNIIGFVAATINIEEALIVMELAACSLHSVIHEDSPVTVSFVDKVNWLADVARGLRYLHFFKIIHRDIKPANILLVYKESADGYVAKIADFGVSTAVGPTTRRTGVRVQQVGTCAYDAPEVCSDAVYSSASDIYAWGVTANELLTGEIPWKDARDDRHITRMVVDGGRRPELFVPSSADERELMRIIGSSSSQALAQQPTQRPAASTLCDDLSRLILSLQPGQESTRREPITMPTCFVCSYEYSANRKCFTICREGHYLCESCKNICIRRGDACPHCRCSFLPGGGVLNRGIMDIVDLMATLSGPAALVPDRSPPRRDQPLARSIPSAAASPLVAPASPRVPSPAVTPAGITRVSPSAAVASCAIRAVGHVSMLLKLFEDT